MNGVTTPSTAPEPIRPQPLQVLVTDAVPLNAGDEALLRAVLGGLARIWPDARITVLCRQASLVAPLLPDVRIRNGLSRRSQMAPGWRGVVVARLSDVRAEWLYRQSDIVISMPGGFLNARYDTTPALRGYELATRLGKPLVLFGQSIGPIAPELAPEYARLLSKAALICTRDDISIGHLEACGVRGPMITTIPDVAFGLRHLWGHVYEKHRGTVRKVALSFRVWPLGDLDARAITIPKARRLVEFLASRGVEQFLFVSTCQGTPGYVDDSDMSARIVSGLDPALRARCVVDRVRRNPRSLLRVLTSCDAAIGMRLHLAILAMLCGIPAMGLAYETKTPEIFRQLRLQKYQLPFERPATSWIECAGTFLDDVPEIRRVLPRRLDLAADGVDRAFGLLSDVYAAGGRPPARD
jgi:colanic acid/amylovoran biosynthesis protein